jgi:ABC-type glycerol-3-phosphate transport system substrate-binding protein
MKRILKACMHALLICVAITACGGGGGSGASVDKLKIVGSGS